MKNCSAAGAGIGSTNSEAATAVAPPITRGVLETSPHVIMGEAETPSRPGANSGVIATSRSCSRLCRLFRACRSCSNDLGGASKSVFVEASVV